MAKRGYKIERFQGRDGQWYFHRKSSNGKITAPSQGYSTKSNCTRAIKKLFPGLIIIDMED